MSADNGIYILKCKEKCKVAHITDISRMFYPPTYEEINPYQAYTLFREGYDANDMNEATDIAEEILNEIGYCEHGIVIIPANKAWWYIKKRGTE